jgi:hypothetical protein
VQVETDGAADYEKEEKIQEIIKDLIQSSPVYDKALSPPSSMGSTPARSPPMSMGVGAPGQRSVVVWGVKGKPGDIVVSGDFSCIFFFYLVN